ncbi:MAG: hypothetical protein R8N23_12260 [Reichenbachiella sp.]|uniref:hypothetical protein n=1 Tax=Reichenbachiella sp. TaxID=2184521 RepID=UPI002966DC77|nr:hypothetical protein [Reichenbachiella sp.]MDW3210639.1 hypothetical protein [Reichenbachiella sp.]
MRPICNLSFGGIILLSFILIPSCAPLLKVHQGAEKTKGIPFYTQTEVLKKQTQYLYKWNAVTFVKEEGDKKTVLISREVPINDEGLDSAIELMDRLNSLSSSYKMAQRQLVYEINSIRQTLPGKKSTRSSKEDKIKQLFEQSARNQVNQEIEINDLVAKIIDTIRSINQRTNHPQEDTSSLQELIVSNSITSSLEIDYNTTYYLNANMPYFGSASLSQKLTEKGILTEATATADNQIDELVSSLGAIATGLAAPLASVKVAEIEADKDELQDAEAFGAPVTLPETKPVVYNLIIQEKGYLYTFTKTLCSSPCYSPKDGTAIPFDPVNSFYSRVNWPATSSEPKKEESKNPTIGISGSIILPKDENK